MLSGRKGGVPAMLRPMKFRTISLLFACGCVFTSPAAAWGPWSVNPHTPVLSEEKNPSHSHPEPEGYDPFSSFLAGGVRFFQTWISPVDGDRCTMTPTCSQYSLQAIRRHGPWLGFAMSADRIVHEYEEQRYVPLVRRGGRFRYLDPVGNNDFWFHHPLPSVRRGNSPAGSRP